MNLKAFFFVGLGVIFLHNALTYSGGPTWSCPPQPHIQKPRQCAFGCAGCMVKQIPLYLAMIETTNPQTCLQTCAQHCDTTWPCTSHIKQCPFDNKGAQECSCNLLNNNECNCNSAMIAKKQCTTCLCNPSMSSCNANYNCKADCYNKCASPNAIAAFQEAVAKGPMGICVAMGCPDCYLQNSCIGPDCSSCILMYNFSNLQTWMDIVKCITSCSCEENASCTKDCTCTPTANCDCVTCQCAPSKDCLTKCLQNAPQNALDYCINQNIQDCIAPNCLAQCNKDHPCNSTFSECRYSQPTCSDPKRCTCDPSITSCYTNYQCKLTCMAQPSKSTAVTTSATSALHTVKQRYVQNAFIKK